VPQRIQVLYGSLLVDQLKFITILRDPQSRAYSWFRFFAMNAVEGKAWARDQLSHEYWFHFSPQTFEKWVHDQLVIKNRCQVEKGVTSSRLWPDCDSETGLFGGLYEAQLRHWLTTTTTTTATTATSGEEKLVFSPSQFILIPLECYTSFPSDMIGYIASVLNVEVGYSFADLEGGGGKYQQENAKRLKQLDTSNNKAVWANKHSEQPIPEKTVAYLNDFFAEESMRMKQLIIDFPGIHCATCELNYFYK
jgi:hypothetical protein